MQLQERITVKPKRQVTLPFFRKERKMKVQSSVNCFCFDRYFKKNEIYDFKEEFGEKLIKHDSSTFVKVEDKIADVEVPNKSVKGFQKKG